MSTTMTTSAQGPERGFQAPGPGTPTPDSPRSKYLSVALFRILQMAKAALIALAVLLILGGLTRPEQFLTIGNLNAVLLFWPIVAICAMGQLMAILSGGIDLSLAGTFSLVGASAMMLHSAGVDDATTVLVGLSVGVLCGLINGILIGYLRVIPLACTLATLFLFGGIATWITGGSTLYGAPEALRTIVRGGIGPVPSTVILGLVILVIAAAFLYRTSTGLRIRALGDLSKIEQVVGVRRRVMQLWVYGLAGLLFAIASLVQMGTLNSYYPSGGNDLLLPAVAAAALGGASLTGGSGSVFGASIGALVLATVSNVFDLLGLSPEAHQIGIGVVLVVTLLVERWLNARRRRSQVKQREEQVV